MFPRRFEEDVYPSSHQKEINDLSLACICTQQTMTRGVLGENIYPHNLPSLPRVKTRSIAFKALGIS